MKSHSKLFIYNTMNDPARLDYITICFPSCFFYVPIPYNLFPTFFWISTGLYYPIFIRILLKTFCIFKQKCLISLIMVSFWLMYAAVLNISTTIVFFNATVLTCFNANLFENRTLLYETNIDFIYIFFFCAFYLIHPWILFLAESFPSNYKTFL